MQQKPQNFEMHPNNSVDQREVKIELVDGLEFEGERVKDASQF